MKRCQLLLYINTTLNWGLIFTAVSSQQAIIISAWGQILRWCKILEHQVISLTIPITLQKVFNQHKENYAHSTAARLRPALMDSNCIHEMQRRFFTLKTLQHLPCAEHQSQRLSLQKHLATHAPYTHCPWSKAKLCRCSWKIPCSRAVTLSPKTWQLSLSCKSSRPSTQGKHRKADCVSTQPAGICWFSTIVTLLSTLCWGPHSNINLGLCSRLNPCPPQAGSAIHLVCVHFP